MRTFQCLAGSLENCLGTAALVKANQFLTVGQMIIDVGICSIVIKMSDD